MAEYELSWWPEDITNDKNKTRNFMILIKEAKTLSGSTSELLNTVKKAGETLKEQYNSATSGGNIHSERDRRERLIKADTIDGIALPLPNELSDEQSHQWDAETGLATGLKESFLSKIGFDGFVKGASKVVAVGASSSGYRKPMVDPGYFQDYKGTQPRNFNFSWDLVPNNREEANQIFTIIKKFKKYTLPTSSATGISMVSPYMFEIIVGNEHVNEMMNMANVVCTSMNVNYSADNSLQFFSGGVPKYITLSLSFAERITVTSEFY